MLLLLELLDHRVVQVKRQSLERWRWVRRKFALLRNAVPQLAHKEQAHQKREGRAEQYDRRSQNQRIGQDSHQSPPYQCRNRLPKKNAIRAMLPRKTPNGIW